MKTALAAALAFAVLGGGLAQAQEGPPPGAFAATTLRLSAAGEVRVAPDMASLSLGVETAAPTAEGAMRANAQKMSEVTAALKRAGIGPADLQTSSLSLSPQYAYEQGKPPRLTGYQASNQLSVTVRDLARVGAIADAAVTSGANTVGQITFGLAEPTATEDRARVAAVKALEDKAALYARTTGYQIKRLVSLSEGAPMEIGPRPVPMMAMRAAAATPNTPVEAGEMNTRVEVSGVFELTR